jgi:hypothetical protein
MNPKYSAGKWRWDAKRRDFFFAPYKPGQLRECPPHLSEKSLAGRAFQAKAEWVPEKKKLRQEKEKRRERRKERHEAFGPIFDSTPAYVRKYAVSMVYSARGRARVLGVPFSLTIAWAVERLVAGKCELTGIDFDMRGKLRPGEGIRSSFGPSLDRKHPILGYTPENCRIVIWAYNGAKGSGTDEEVMQMAEALVRRKALKDGTPAP